MEFQRRNLTIRMKGKDVNLLQQELRKLGYQIEDRDSYFGSSTRKAVLEFQRSHGLKPTGKTNRSTWDAIIEAVNVEENHPHHTPYSSTLRQKALTKTAQKSTSANQLLLYFRFDPGFQFQDRMIA